MAGVVAMASVIEDFDTQPCKKRCKDVDNPMVKTITNYFSPVAKPAENTFSPPRSNNIMDYFNRKGPSPKNRVPSPKQSKENCQAVKQSNLPPAPKQPAQKRRKASKTARTLIEAVTTCPAEDTSCIVSEEMDSTAEVTKPCGILGTDKAIISKQIDAESSVFSENSENKNGGQNKKTLLVKANKHLNNISPIVPPKNKSKKVKTADGNSKIQLQEERLPDPEMKETKKSLCDISMEVNVDEASQLNKSMVTISFEDFVRSQDQDLSNNELCKESATMVENEQLSSAEDNIRESFLQISPRTVTIQAEVHAISPKGDVKTSGQVASVVSMRKGTSPVRATSPQTEAGLQTHSVLSKWKSNVVLQEKDVELYVLESSTPKCSQAERKQFMAAFKQPSDGAKTKLSKNQSKQKQTGDKMADATDKISEEDPADQTTAIQEKLIATSQNNEVLKKKPSKKRQKITKEEKEATSSPANVLEEDADVMFVDHKEEKQPPNTSTSSVPVVRRSRRKAVVRQTSHTSVSESPPNSSTKQFSLKDSAASNPDVPTEVSSPKKHKSKHGVFKAEMLCNPGTKESSLRIRFIRLSKCQSKEEHENTMSNPFAKDTKKTKQAKKLLEKAKAMKQNKISAEKTQRRSLRTEASLKRSYCEDEDSIICVEESQTTTPQSVSEKSKPKKPLRSLNDVLGKAAGNKESKATPGSKVCQEKPSRKPPLVVSIFDDSSREGSENSQDDEQFRARREFLKSGLPETFKKQMAKTAAVKEAYTAACSAFQPVVHINQPPTDCIFWSLPWPESSLLQPLKAIWSQFSNPLSLNSGLINIKTRPVHKVFIEKASSWRPEIPTSVRELLLKEISSSNPAFPVQKFISLFLKRRADLRQCTPTVSSSKLPSEVIGGKRKRTTEEGEIVKVAKKQRSSRSGEKLNAPTAEKEPVQIEGRTRRRQTVSKEDKMKSEPSQKEDLAHSADDAVIVLDDSPLGQKTVKQDLLKEDMLWTEKYQPQHSSEVIGNTASVRRLHSWLKEWKIRADKEDIKKKKDKKQEEGSIDSDWECGGDDSHDGEDMLCNTMLVTGPTGVGKTAAVYACAQELGFKVFEVNASSQRSGRLILSQLKEATQSHQVDSQGVNAHKPTYFNSYSTTTLRPGSSPRKVNSPHRAVSSPRKLPQSPRATKRGGLAPTALANFFKMTKPIDKDHPKVKEEQTAVPKKKRNKGDINSPSIKSPKHSLAKDNAEEQSKKTATSLILFEEVDVIFEDDTGFLSAIKTFMTTTKRPVILTTSDPAFCTVFDGSFEEIIFETPSLLSATSYLQLLCLAEDIRTDMNDISSLLCLHACDIRKTLLQLQFWTCSGGELQQKTEDTAADAEIKDADFFPVCNRGSTESMLGLLNIEPQRNIWELLKTQSLSEDTEKLLAMSRQQGLDLLYSNMERLLPLPIRTLAICNKKHQQSLPLSLDQPSVNPSQSQNLSSHDRLLLHNDDVFSDDSSPVKVSNNMRKNRKRHCLPVQGALHSDSDSEDSFLSISCQNTPKKKKNVLSVPMKVMRKPPSREEQMKSIPVSQCLHSLSDFLDDMSLVDLLSNDYCDIGGRTCGSAVVKDGLTDESRIESEKRSFMMAEYASEIQATVQRMSFNKCRQSVSCAWEKVQQLDKELREEATAELTLPVASHNKCFTLTQHGLCQPPVVQQRTKLMDELMQKGVFGSVGNRAAAQDYLPTLRTICRAEQLKEQGKVKRRFLHYLDAIQLGLSKSTLQHLAEDFP